MALKLQSIGEIGGSIHGNRSWPLHDVVILSVIGDNFSALFIQNNGWDDDNKQRDVLKLCGL